MDRDQDLIQHVSDCWMTEHWCRALWLSGLDPGGSGFEGGDAEKRWSQVCDKSWFPPILPNCPSTPASSNSSLPLKSAYGCHNGKSSLHLRAGQETTAVQGLTMLPLRLKQTSHRHTRTHTLLPRQAISNIHIQTTVASSKTLTRLQMGHVLYSEGTQDTMMWCHRMLHVMSRAHRV